VLDAAHAAFAHGLNVAAIVAGGALAVCAVAAARLLPQPATAAEPLVGPVTARA